MSFAAQPILNVTMDAANQLLDPSIYVQSVLLAQAN
jgi:hypothetical protein